MMVNSPEMTAQQRFNDKYITATEVAEFVGVSRVSVLRAKQRGLLPDAIHVGDNHVCIWERSPVMPYVDAWKKAIDVRGKSA